MKVKLTYFTPRGKYYTDGEYETEKTNLWEIVEEVNVLARERKLPGLIEGHSQFIVHVDVPEHPNNHPNLVLP
jgi:hypothetical protein